MWQEMAKLKRYIIGDPASLTLAEIKRLIAQCHPDKWSQGQPATALAHELSIVINELRQREGRQP